MWKREENGGKKSKPRLTLLSGELTFQPYSTTRTPHSKNPRKEKNSGVRGKKRKIKKGSETEVMAVRLSCLPVTFSNLQLRLHAFSCFFCYLVSFLGPGDWAARFLDLRIHLFVSALAQQVNNLSTAPAPLPQQQDDSAVKTTGWSCRRPWFDSQL